LASNTFAFLGRDMAVDLGTANTLVYVRGKGIVLNEPSVVAINTNTKGILAVGTEAKRMIGRTPGNIVAIRPLKDGVIADFETTERMLRYFIQKVHRRRHMAKPRVVVCVPSGITGVEQRAVEQAGYHAGARRSTSSRSRWPRRSGRACPSASRPATWSSTSAAARPRSPWSPSAASSPARASASAGDEQDNAIIQYVKKEYSLMLGERTAEEIKMAIGSAFPMPTSRTPRSAAATWSPACRRRSSCRPRRSARRSRSRQPDRRRGEDDARQVPAGALRRHHGPRHRHHRRRALLRGLDERLKHETGMPIHITDNPLHSVAIGSGKCVEDFEALKPVLISSPRH
jgi:rod shape-determining protein MreB